MHATASFAVNRTARSDSGAGMVAFIAAEGGLRPSRAISIIRIIKGR